MMWITYNSYPTYLLSKKNKNKKHTKNLEFMCEALIYLYRGLLKVLKFFFEKPSLDQQLRLKNRKQLFQSLDLQHQLY